MKEDLQAVLNHIILLRKTYKETVEAHNNMVDDNNKLIEELRVQETLAIRRLGIVEY